MVKTPGLSPLKTRLAKGIGENEALHFYKLALNCIRDVAHRICIDNNEPDNAHWSFAWAIAEEKPNAEHFWNDFPLFEQGEGGLGERLGRIHHLQYQLADVCLIIGADSPHLQPLHLKQSIDFIIQGTDIVFGPSADGGFWLFASRKELPQSIWSKVNYSQPSTLVDLIAEIKKWDSSLTIDKVSLDVLTDVDEKSDLVHLHHALNALNHLSLSLQELKSWLDSLAAGNFFCQELNL